MVRLSPSGFSVHTGPSGAQYVVVVIPQHFCSMAVSTTTSSSCRTGADARSQAARKVANVPKEVSDSSSPAAPQNDSRTGFSAAGYKIGALSPLGG